jgi:hypothetical protein
MKRIIDNGHQTKNKEVRVGKALTYGIDISEHGNCDEMKTKIEFYDLRMFSNKAARTHSTLAGNDMI